jgi:plastocyanin
MNRRVPLMCVLLLLPTPMLFSPSFGEVPAAGTIVGEVVIPDRPARRVAERYPAAAGGPSREQPPVPTVAHIEGSFAAAAAAPSALRMVQRDTAFVPGLLVVLTGQSIAFPNDDPFFHNVFSYSRPKRFDLGRFPQGESKSVTFDRPGYLKVFCEIHQWMRGAILVTDNPYHATVDEDGSFTIRGVPPGRHTLVVTDFDRGSRSVEVDVPDGGTARISVEFGR